MSEWERVYGSVKQWIWKRIRRKKSSLLKIFIRCGGEWERKMKLNWIHSLCCCLPACLLLYWIWFSLIEYLFCKRFCRGFFFIGVCMNVWILFYICFKKKKKKRFQSFTGSSCLALESCWSVKKIIIFRIP